MHVVPIHGTIRTNNNPSGAHTMTLSKTSRRGIIAVLLAAAGAAAAGFVTAEDTEGALLERALGVFRPLPDTAHVDDYPHSAARVELGRQLFFETRVANDGRTSCATCHNPALYGTDALPQSVGVNGQKLPRNAHTVFNTALLVAQHYGGNRVSVEEQAQKALLSPLAYGNKSFEEAEEKLRALGYEKLFDAAFPNEKEPVTAEHWGTAIGAYERTLLTPAPFDRYLKGDTRAISAEAKLGLDKFMSYGCAACHSGSTVGGTMFQKFGLTEDYWKATGSVEMPLLKGRDMGKFHDTGKEADKWIFKVPQLRNVAKTPPYFHDGSVATLDDAVRVMARLQLGRQLSDDDVRHLVAFLETLTGDVPKNFSQVPELPVAAFGGK